MKLFIDYTRRQPEGWARGLSNISATAVVKQYRRKIKEISIGDDEDPVVNFKPTIKYIAKLFSDGKLDKETVRVTIHSDNPEWSNWVIDKFNSVDVKCEQVKHEPTK